MIWQWILLSWQKIQMAHATHCDSSARYCNCWKFRGPIWFDTYMPLKHHNGNPRRCCRASQADKHWGTNVCGESWCSNLEAMTITRVKHCVILRHFNNEHTRNQLLLCPAKKYPWESVVLTRHEACVQEKCSSLVHTNMSYMETK